MNIRKSLISISFLSVLCLTACSSEPKSLEKLAVVDAEKTELRNRGSLNLSANLKNSYDDFAIKTSALCKDDENNTCISPLSIYSALSMLTGITNGETQNEILNYLNISYNDLVSGYSNLYKASNLYNSETEEYVELLNNSIWLQDGMEFKMDGIKKASSDFYTDIYSLDFADPKSSKYISDYIKEKTFDLIDEEMKFNEETKLALINTLYVKDNWLQFGDDLSITNEKIRFVNSDNTFKDDNFLIKSSNGKKYSNQYMDSFKATTYNGYEIKFIVPKDGYKINDIFNETNIREALNANYFDYDQEQYKYITTAKFPMFSAESNMKLNEFLNNSGIRKVFTDSAEFNNITNYPLYCSNVQHISKIEVDRKGLKGAAMTRVDMDAASSAPGDRQIIREDFIVNKAFGYIVLNSRGVLFTGIINKL